MANAATISADRNVWRCTCRLQDAAQYPQWRQAAKLNGPMMAGYTTAVAAQSQPDMVEREHCRTHAEAQRGPREKSQKGDCAQDKERY